MLICSASTLVCNKPNGFIIGAQVMNEGFIHYWGCDWNTVHVYFFSAGTPIMGKPIMAKPIASRAQFFPGLG